jgi:hypothetical protein
MKQDERGPERFDEPRIRQILRRAIEIDDNTANTLDAGQLRQIAESVGISADALNQAIREGRDAEMARTTTIRRFRRIRRVLAGITALMSAASAKFIGLLIANEGRYELLVAAIAPLAAIALILALYNRLRGDQRTFQVDNATIWCSFIVGSLLVGRSIPADILAGALAWAVLAGLGSLIVGRRSAHPPGMGRADVMDRVVTVARFCQRHRWRRSPRPASMGAVRTIPPSIAQPILAPGTGTGQEAVSLSIEWVATNPGHSGRTHGGAGRVRSPSGRALASGP